MRRLEPCPRWRWVPARRAAGGARPAAPLHRGLPYSLGRRADLDRVAEAAGDGVVAWVADARDPRELAAAAGEAERRWGGLGAAIARGGGIAGGGPARA